MKKITIPLAMVIYASHISLGFQIDAERLLHQNQGLKDLQIWICSGTKSLEELTLKMTGQLIKKRQIQMNPALLEKEDRIKDMQSRK